jgi:precorrin-2 dehydrogenase/sirohydrochlorin ferrochelatase
MQFPVNLNLTGRRCLVVGGGRIALRKARQLLECGGVVVVVAPSIVEGFDATSAELERRPYRVSDLDGVHLVITATGDPTVDQAIFDECERRRIWVNSADDPERCSFTLPATLRRGPVLVTASTGGTSPALASWLRDRLAAVVGPEFEAIAEELGRERARMHAAGVSTETIDWQPLIESLVAAHSDSATEADTTVDMQSTTAELALEPAR